LKWASQESRKKAQEWGCLTGLGGENFEMARKKISCKVSELWGKISGGSQGLIKEPTKVDLAAYQCSGEKKSQGYGKKKVLAKEKKDT